MPRRDVIFVNNEFYHLYNRTSGAVDIFKSAKNIKRFLSLLDYYRYPQKLKFSKFNTLPREEKYKYEKTFRNQQPIIEIYAFAIMPNHYHLLVKQIKDAGIAKFISNVQNGLAKYHNIRHKRYGSVFQGPFKAKRIEKDEYLVHVSRYIHLNPVTSYLIEIDELQNYPLTSFPYYLKEKNKKDDLVKTSLITAIIGSKDKYKEFVFNQSDYQRKLKNIEGIVID